MMRGVSFRQESNSADWIGYGYAVLLAVGGVVGYIKADSITSLVAGLLFGLLAAAGTYLSSQQPKYMWLSLATSATMAVAMGFRFVNSWTMMPAGLVTLASVLMVVKILMAMRAARKKL